MVTRRTHRALALARRLWRDELRAFASRDAGGAWRPLAADDLLPLWSGAAPRYQARALLELHLGQEREGQGFWSVWPLATLPQDAPGYAPQTRGQGAVDPLLNWLMVRGLYRYGADDQARELAEATVRLAARHGLAPAYDATTGHPVGPEAELDWAPTAALVLDLLKTPPDYDRW
jgi:glycogen debranching enzyme